MEPVESKNTNPPNVPPIFGRVFKGTKKGKVDGKDPFPTVLANISATYPKDAQNVVVFFFYKISQNPKKNEIIRYFVFLIYLIKSSGFNEPT